MGEDIDWIYDELDGIARLHHAGDHAHCVTMIR